MYPQSQAARRYLREWESGRGWYSGFADGMSSLLLKSARAVALAAGAEVQSQELRADLWALAQEIERELFDVLSVLTVRRDDVETMLEQLRDERFPEWPATISAEAWRRLERSYYLRDIANVVCGGGDYWFAIESALEDEFAP